VHRLDLVRDPSRPRRRGARGAFRPHRRFVTSTGRPPLAIRNQTHGPAQGISAGGRRGQAGAQLGEGDHEAPRGEPADEAAGTARDEGLELQVGRHASGLAARAPVAAQRQARQPDCGRVKPTSAAVAGVEPPARRGARMKQIKSPGSTCGSCAASHLDAGRASWLGVPLRGGPRRTRPATASAPGGDRPRHCAAWKASAGGSAAGVGRRADRPPRKNPAGWRCSMGAAAPRRAPRGGAVRASGGASCALVTDVMCSRGGIPGRLAGSADVVTPSHRQRTGTPPGKRAAVCPTPTCDQKPGRAEPAQLTAATPPTCPRADAAGSSPSASTGARSRTRPTRDLVRRTWDFDPDESGAKSSARQWFVRIALMQLGGDADAVSARGLAFPLL